MIEKRDFDVLDYLLIISKWKKVLLLILILSAVTSYFTIYFFIPVRYDATALILPSEQDQTSVMGSLLKSFSNLPVSIPGLKSSKSDIYKTIMFSRTMIEKLIDRFELAKEYKSKTFVDLLEDVTSDISAEDTKEGAYEIKIRASSPQKAADMTNFIIKELNEMLIKLNIQKSKDNRIFLEKRYDEVKRNLKNSEDSLTHYQKSSGIMLAEEQTIASIETYTKMEAELASKQSELAVLQKIYGDESPQAKNTAIAVNEYKNKLDMLKKGQGNSDLIMSLKNLPANAMTYVRLFRDVEIYNKMLEFIIPLYEQVRYEEQKNVPILQIVDYAKAPDKKAYPKRMLITTIIVFVVFCLSIFMIILREIFINSDNPKVINLRKSLKFKG